ncbi:prolyl oligopeptidase family serine peptidase [Spirosoma sp. HMF4905]|uniref:prolyl oligopeptidase n=1 Tax=Spirosoma arboris TaxID=2682092 RepID=A0A7K1SC53_9BACT|nr:prolyl oligopeptidase family serine peptidase [Spirosoma arboris]MVM31379.1 prolyl oligopeptidase family serine peptidase [Spirosoma arboris]
MKPFLVASLYLGLSLPVLAQSERQIARPISPKRPVVDTYFGKVVTDNYRWMEDMNSQQTKDWFKAQGDYSNSVLAQIPGRDSLVNTFVRYDALKSVNYSDIRRKGNRYFYRKTLPKENVSKLYYRDGKMGAEMLLFDPTTYDKAKKYAVSGYQPSEDGQKLTIGLAEGGAEISIMRIMDVATKTFYPESITAVFGYDNYGWSPDGKGFIYKQLSSDNPQLPAAHLDNKSFYHRIGTEPGTDTELFSRNRYPTLGIKSAELPLVFYSDDFSMLFGILATADNRLNGFMAPANELLQPTIGWQRFVTLTDSVYNLATVGNQLFLQSHKGASKGRVLVTDARHPSVQNATVLLPEGKWTITGISAGKNFLFVQLNDGINDHVRQYDVRSAQWADVSLPLTGTVRFSPYSPISNDGLLLISSWKQPPTVYDYDPATKQFSTSPFNVPVTYPGVTDLIVEELEVPSHDGVMVPLSLIYRKGLKKDGSQITYMTGYGAYGSSAKPFFNPRYLALLNKGVVVAITHPRGGREKGESWHTAGYKTTKPNTWKDFIACGEYLINKKYTSPKHLIGEGTSAGGILIGRAITERPDLFAAAICNVADCNTLRSEYGTDGPVNAAEYGTVKDSVECMALYEMDALSHVKEGVNYPAVIGVGGINDPRVMAWQPGKFAAALQNATASGKPVLMQVNYDNGHFTEDKAVTFRNFANMYAFALWQAGHPDFQPSDARSVRAKATSTEKK